MIERGRYYHDVNHHHSVLCGRCEAVEWDEGPFLTERAMKKLFRSVGWATRKGKWYCPECKYATKEARND